MARCEHISNCKNASSECSRLSHPFMNVKKRCYESSQCITETLEYDTWYWVAHPHDGDVWFPVYVNANFEWELDGKFHDILELKSIIVRKAVMPVE